MKPISPGDETRAEQIAQNEGLEADQVNERHFEQARRELMGEQIPPDDLPVENVETFNPQEPVGTPGRMAPRILQVMKRALPKNWFLKELRMRFLKKCKPQMKSLMKKIKRWSDRKWFFLFLRESSGSF